MTIKASMGDLLGLYGLLRHFVEARLPADGRIGAEVDNFQMACKAVDLLVAAKKRRVPVRAAGRQLQALLAQHLQAHLLSHGASRVRPKTHLAFDIAECMQQDDMLVDAFTTERLHQRVKGVANHCKDPTNYEYAVLAGVLNVQQNTLSEEGASTVALVGATASMPGAPNIAIADKARYHGEAFAAGDFALRGVCVCAWAG